MILRLLDLLCLNGGDCDNAYHLLNAAAPGKIVYGSGETLEEAVCVGFADTLDQLVADVACLKVREDEDVGLSCDG